MVVRSSCADVDKEKSATSDLDAGASLIDRHRRLLAVADAPLWMQVGERSAKPEISSAVVVQDDDQECLCGDSASEAGGLGGAVLHSETSGLVLDARRAAVLLRGSEELAHPLWA